MRIAGLVTTVLLAAAIVNGEASAAEIVLADADGWHTWQTADASAVTEMCCYTWKRGEPVKSGCNLDNSRVSYGHRSDCSVASAPVQLYVQIRDGRPTRIRAVSAACPVTATSAIKDHGVVSAKDTIAWFRKVIEDSGLDRDVRDEALFGLVQTGSDEAFDYLDRLLSRR